MNENLETTFAQEWPRFLDNLQTVCQERIRRRNSDAFNNLEGILTGVVGDLQGESSRNAILTAADEASREPGPVRAFDFLTQELAFFNARVGEIANGPRGLGEAKDGDLNDTLGAGSTIKESVEDFLEKWLPDWVKKLLKILNELISIVRGG